MANNKKLCYILPFFDLETDTHYFYLYDFIKRVADDFELTLLIEKSNSDIKFFDNVKNIKVQKFNSGLWRILENFWLILFIRLGGTRDFYIHYQKLFEAAVELIKKNKAYVDHLNADEIREYRGTLTAPGKDSPYRNRMPQENLELFEKMKNGEN